MRRVFDHVESRLVTVNYTGEMAPEMSGVMGTRFGPRRETSNIITYLGDSDAISAEYLGLGLEQLEDDGMPAEVVICQFPRRFPREQGV